MPCSFTATLEGEGGKIGIEVPADIIETLGAGARPPVAVDLNGYHYRNTVGVMGGRHLISVNKEVRDATGLGAGDTVTVTLRVDTSPREVNVPEDLARALSANPAAKAFFESLSNSLQRYHVGNVESAKTPETRQKRVDKAVELFLTGEQR